MAQYRAGLPAKQSRDADQGSLGLNYDMRINLQRLTYDLAAEDHAGRCPAVHQKEDGTTTPLVLEWVSSLPPGLHISLIQLRDELPTNQSRHRRAEEARTLRFAGLKEGEDNRVALAYELPYVPATLRDVLLNVPKPTPSDRCMLAKLVATQVRSLHVHFRNKHMGLRTESFVFLRDASLANGAKKQNGAGVKGLDLRNPYLLDWGRESCPSVYQHPDFQAAGKLWYYDVWSLLIVLSEIADWKPLEVGGVGNERELREKKMEVRRRVTSAEWKGEVTARIFRFGFEFLEVKGIERMSWGGIKRFFDKLCELLEASGGTSG